MVGRLILTCSLDAQREAAEAYIKSQKHEGAKQGEFTRIDGQHTAGAEGVWIARARLRGGREGHTGHRANKQCNDKAHRTSHTHLLA